MYRPLPTIIILVALLLPGVAQAYVRPVCEGYQIDSKNIITFNANELKLICGDKEVESWEKIPRFQAEYFIKNFLQRRGYFYPEFRESNGMLTIIPGKRSKITGIDVEGSPPAKFKVWKRRLIRGGLLTPGALNTLENWTKGELKNWGYACPAVKSKANARTGAVNLQIDPGERMKIISLDDEVVEGLKPKTLQRFNAFHVGDTYNHLNLSLTARRIAKDGILQSSYFLTSCTPEGVELIQKSIPGPKRLISVGVGGSTEEYLIVKSTWKQSRIGSNGSSFEVSGRFSYRKQRLLLHSQIYPFRNPTPWHVAPSFQTKHNDQNRYEYLANDLWIPMAYNWDTPNTGFLLTFGPNRQPRF